MSLPNKMNYQKPIKSDSELYLTVDGPLFKDSLGRNLQLRGVNMSGSVKSPSAPYLPSHISEAFFESEKIVSFVNRPFPLHEADEHLSRLKHWGFNFIRLNVTWEALEHGGPGVYDMDFINYLVKVCIKLKEYGFRCFIDPHQDVWSRFSGGSGAPGWTLRLAGFEPSNFKATGAAIHQNTHDDPDNYPKMIWPTNYMKLACATMFTLFFGGKTFAPHIQIEGVSIQDYLQNHYMASFCKLITALKEFGGLLDSVVVGYDTLNEPHQGYIGVHDIQVFPPEFELRKGDTPTPLQSMLMGVGHACKVDVWDFTWHGPAKFTTKIIDPKGVSAWSHKDIEIANTPQYFFSDSPVTNGCIWANRGLYDPVTKKCLKHDYFAKFPDSGKPVDFLVDFWLPFVAKFTTTIRNVHPNAIIFIEPPVNEHPPDMSTLTNKSGRFAYAPHWYDGLTLLNKKFNSWFTIDYLAVKRGLQNYLTALRFGEKGIKNCFKSQLNMIRNEGHKFIGQYPCILGEIGIPYDMDEKEAFKTGLYSSQIKAMDANLYALERNFLNFTLWNYCADNCNNYGDQWNGEDLSIFSRIVRKMSVMLEPMTSRMSLDVSRMSIGDEQTDSGIVRSISKITSRKSTKKFPRLPSDLNAGGRALEAFVRPYPVAVAGVPLFFSFDIKTSIMIFVFEHTASVSNSTEFFLPHLQYTIPSEVLYLHDCAGAEFNIEYIDQRCEFKCNCSGEGRVGRKHYLMLRRAIGEKGGVRLLTSKDRKLIDYSE